MTGTIHIKAIIGLTLGISTGLVWAVEVVTAQPETSLERMFNTFLGSLPILIAAIASAWLSFRASNKADLAAEKAAIAAEKAVVVADTVGVIATKTEEIGKQTDGHLTILREELAKFREKDALELKALHDFMLDEIARRVPVAPATPAIPALPLTGAPLAVSVEELKDKKS